MLSQLELGYDLDVNTLGYILERIENPKIGTKIKVYIPRIMQDVNSRNVPDKPEEYISSTSYNNCFCNDSSCKPRLTSHTFKEQNYVVAKLENSIDLKPVMDYLRDETGDLVATYVDKNKKIRCRFKNGKLSQLRLNTDDTLSDLSTDIEF